MAAQHGWADVVALLLKLEGIKVNSRDNEGKTALAHAIRKRHVKILEALVKVDPISTKYATPDGLNYLMLAATTNDAELICSVLQLAQFNVNARDVYGRTALAHAVKSRSYNAVKALLEVEGIDVHCVDEDGRTLLMDATEVPFEGLAMINRFLGLGLEANINATDNEGKTALLYALECCWPQPEIVSALLEVEGIDLSVRDVKGRTPLMVAIEKGNDKCTELLREAGAS
ncbi:ankyrin [Coprinopsis marcescibilis]|uniref:Ankyrin n=1 Tax=Coprinopsis marcescibilis TaxID=230819 RepID=A0A5C3KPE7_COPMA|nr:ankyrin [Coprinopsis marcescibilis]